ncbi:hypothetical protein [Aporhodopirellula aestuarii]|uniref:Uncharacterized protein n=1 Tax=Aporhodopirellula aestuarii TaxID=2950107 RepID=A0ABT0UAF0_9BACT|nr:hypothetical protein [Aporhodopirellula aestuarii]MCM2373875.1 hypothetical protein [Aporhodopirellula aestuarii]
MNDANLQAIQEAFASAAIPIALLGLILIVGMFLVTGYSMKFALAVAGVGRFGFWKSIGIVLVTGMMSMFVSLSIVFAFPGEPVAGLAACVVSIGAYAVIVSLIGQCGIGRGIATYFLNGLFNGLGMIPLVAVLVMGIVVISKTSGIDQVDFEGLRAELAQSRGQMGAESNAADWGAGFAGFDITQVSGRGFGDPQEGGGLGATQSMPKQLPSLIAADEGQGVFDSFFTDEKSSPYPTPSSSGCNSGCSKNQVTPPKPSEPVTSGIQANPFAK